MQDPNCAISPGTAGQPSTVVVRSTVTASSLPTCTIQVSFVAAFGNSALVKSTTVSVVLMQSLVLQPQSYDYTTAQGYLPNVATNPPAYSTLYPIACNTSDYEQASVLLPGG